MDDLDFLKLAVPVVSSWVAPAIQKVVGKYAELKLDQFALWSSAFEAYITRSYEKYQFINTIALPNRRLKLDDLYEPLTLSVTEAEIHLINKYPGGLFDSYKRVLVVDTAGMGKSTVAKFIFLSAIRENIGIPILIELRRLSKEKTILTFLREELAELQGQVSDDLLLKLLKEGGFVFILDGYDEIAQADKADVVADIQEFRERSGENRFLLTSRDEAGLVAFPDFMRANILPLKKEEAFSLIARYANANCMNDAGVRLIEKLKLPESTTVEEFLTNPLLVSLLYKAFDYRPIVPHKRVQFYRQVFDALYSDHDLSKDGGEFVRTKRTGLEVDDFERVLRHLAFIHMRAGRIEYSKDDLLSGISEAHERLPGLKFQASQFLSDITAAVPLFIIDGPHYRWAHKSIHEYFCAQFICRDTKDKQAAILQRLVEEGATHLNLLSLCNELDSKQFAHIVILGVAQSALSRRNRYQYQYAGVTAQSVDLRRALTALDEYVIWHYSPEIGDNNRHNELLASIARMDAICKEAFKDAPQKPEGPGFMVSVLSAPCYSYKSKAVMLRFNSHTGFEFMRDVQSDHIDSEDAQKIIENIIPVEDGWLLTDNPAHPLNAAGVFEAVNAFLLSRVAQRVVDFAACEEIACSIEKSIQASARDLGDFLI